MLNPRIYLILVVLFLACDQPTFPKPTGYIRTDLPAATYVSSEINCPFTFERSSLTKLEKRTDNLCWMNISYPNLKADIHLTYKPINNNLRDYIEESRKLAYDHQFRASNIRTKTINNSVNDVNGICYFLDGEVASNTQFFLTDSLNHFVRGSLYFKSKTNTDSLKPYLDYINSDIDHLISTLKWN